MDKTSTDLLAKKFSNFVIPAQAGIQASVVTRNGPIIHKIEALLS